MHFGFTRSSLEGHRTLQNFRAVDHDTANAPTASKFD
jgi:hypothetical protein